MEALLKTLQSVNPLVLALAGLGIGIIVIVLLVNAVQLRKARASSRELESDAPRPSAPPERVEPSLHPEMTVKEQDSAPWPIGADSSVSDAPPVVGHQEGSVHAQWSERLDEVPAVTAAPAAVAVPAPPQSPPAADPPLIAPGGPREPTAPIDGRVHSIVKLRFMESIPAEVAKAITEQIIGTYPRSHAWIWSHESGAWAGSRSNAAAAHPADAIAFAMPLATRSGAVTETTLREWVAAVASAGRIRGAEVVQPQVGEDAKRAVELDQFCSNIDLVAGVTLMRADRSAIPGTRVRGTLEAEGFRLVPKGYFELVADDGVHPIYEIHSTHGQPMTSESLRYEGVHGLSLTLDVMRVCNPVQQFDLMRALAKRLAQRLEATIVDDRGHALSDAAFAQIRQELEKRVTAARTAGIEPGSPLARTLFGA